MIEIRKGAASHLSDGELSDLVLGMAAAEVRAHVAECAGCAAEVERVSGAVLSFERESRVWAERYAATMPPTPRRSGMLMPGWAAAWTAGAAIAAFGLGVGASHTREQARMEREVVAMTEEAPVASPARLNADNALLGAIDGELRADDAPPASVYGLDVPDQNRDRGTKRISD